MSKKIAIIGGGPGGYTAAVHAASNGAQVTIIEQEALGGTCLHHGCIPSKTFKHSADLLGQLQKPGQSGLNNTDAIGLDLTALQCRKEQIINTQSKAIATMLTTAGVTQLYGNGSVVGQGALSVAKQDGSSQDIAWDKLIIATGSTPLEIKAFPFDGKTILSSDHLLGLQHLPKSLVIIGGGVIGCEFACIMRSFGVEVTIVEAMPRLLPLPDVDQECSKILQRQMKKMGVNFRVNSTVSSINIKNKQAQVEITAANQQTEQITPEQVLVCIGRQANTSALNIHKLGIEQDTNGWILVDDKMQTNVKDVYAIGDALGPQRIMQAHVAIKEGKVAAENCKGGDTKMDYSLIPNVIFSHPEIACVGLSEEQAAASGTQIKTSISLFRTNGKAHVIGEIDGMLKIIAAADSGRLLGIHIIGPNASDLISQGVLALRQGCAAQDLSNAIQAHPTLSEIYMEAAEKMTF